MAPKSSKDELIRDVLRMYQRDGLTLSEISRSLGPSVQTLSRWLQGEGVPLEVRHRNPNASRSAIEQAQINARVSTTRSRQGRRGGRQRLPREVRTCAVLSCQKSFEARVDSTQRCCSQGCHLRLANDQKMKLARERWSASPESKCSCGNEIPFEQRHIWRYCSPECRSTLSKKRQPDPANHVTFNCERCGKEVTRYKSYGNGANRFCSNECSAKSNTQRRVHIDDVSLDSGWEALFWGLCCFLKVPIERFNRADCAPHGDGWYGPDFLAADFYVEVKGLEDDDDRARVEAWRATGKAVAVVDRDALSEWVEKGVTKDDFLLKLLALSQPPRRHTKL